MNDFDSRNQFECAGGQDEKASQLRVHYLALAFLLFVAGAVGMGLETLMSAFVLFAIGLICLTFALPTSQLPGLALLVFALLPVSYLPIDLLFPRGTITPAIGVLLIWELRVLNRPQVGKLTRAATVLGAAAAVVLLTLAIISNNAISSAVWVVVFASTLVAPTYLAGRFEVGTSANLRSVWMVITVCLSIFSLIETIFQSNPLAEFYTVSQHWSVHRAMTTFGHPLMNGAFFATSAVFFAISAIRNRQIGPGLVAAGAATATALTASRSGVIGLIVGVATGLVLLICTSKIRVSTKVIGTIVCFGGAIAVVANPVFQQRLSSDEAAGSAAYRDVYALSDAWRIFGDNWLFGVGPGQAISRIVEASGYVLENAALASLVSLGVIGVTAVVVYLLYLCLASLKLGQHEMPAALATYLVVGLAFPLWETIPSSLFIVTIMLIVVNVGRRGASLSRRRVGSSERAP